MMRPIYTLTVPLVLSIAACKSPGVPVQQPINNQKPSSVQDTSRNDARLERLLNEADLAIAQQRLTTPVEDNAYLRLLQVLAQEPNNVRALDGLNKIVETYIGWAITAIERGEFSRAATLLDRAGSVDENHATVAALRSQVATYRDQQIERYKILQEDLDSRTNTLITQLQKLGKLAEQNTAKVRISAPTDAAGRWIYQQMNATTESRIRATIRSGMSGSVQLIYP